MRLTDLLRPPPPRLAVAVTAEEVGGAGALRAMVLDGALRTFGGGVCAPPHETHTASHRALTLLAHLHARTVIGRASAVWVHAGGPCPRTVQVLYAPDRHRPPPRHGRDSHQATLCPDDVCYLGPVPVTTPERTAVDVAMYAEREEAHEQLTRLVRARVVDPDAVVARLTTLAHRSRCTEALAVAERVFGAGQLSLSSGISWALEPVIR